MEESYDLQIYKEIMHNLEEMVLFVGEDERIRNWNIHATEDLFYEQEEMGSLFLEQIMDRTKENVHNNQWEGTIYRKNGTCFLAKIKQVLIKNEKVSRVLIIENLEKQKRQDATIRELQAQLKEVMDAKQSFLANVTHELRTPINGMRGMALLLKEEVKEQEQQNTLEVMLSCCSNMERIVNDILDYAKLAKEKVKLEEQEFVFADWMQGIIAVQDPVIRQKNLAFSCTVEETVPKRIWGDSYHLGQVLGNLLNNAVKFTKEGTISVEVVVKEKEKQQITLMFVVTDTGIGIREDRKESLFGSFMQADPSITREYGGTGLGLAIAKELVELMEGEIGVESNVGTGSRFYFTVKLKAVQQQEIEPDDQSSVSVTIGARSTKELLSRLAVCMEFSSYEKAEEVAHQLKELLKESNEEAAKQAFRLELALRKQKKDKIAKQYETLRAVLMKQ